jgi:hypothetical protein
MPKHEITKKILAELERSLTQQFQPSKKDNYRILTGLTC